MHSLEFETGCTLPLHKKWITRIWNIFHYKKSNMFYDHPHNSWFTSLSNSDMHKSLDQLGHYGSLVQSTNVLNLKKFSLDTLSIEFLSLLKHYLCQSLVSCYNHIHCFFELFQIPISLESFTKKKENWEGRGGLSTSPKVILSFLKYNNYFT